MPIGSGGVVVIVPWWGYPGAYGYPMYSYPTSPAYPAYDASAPADSGPPDYASPYRSPEPSSSYSMSITPALPLPPPASPEATGATPAQGEAQAAAASCEEAAWVEGYYDTRVWPNGQPETVWVPPHWVCQ